MASQKFQGSYPGATVTVFQAVPEPVDVSLLTRSANVVTAIVPFGSGFVGGELVTIAGAVDTSFNGTFTIATTGPTEFTYSQAGADAASAGATADSALRLSEIFADNNGTPKANPFTSSSDGTWFFYAPNDRYDVRFSGGGLPNPFTLGDFLLYDPQDERGVLIAGRYPGANAGEKIAAALADLPATGGTVDARGLQGSQDITQNMFAGIDKPFELLLGATTFTITAPQAPAVNGVVTIQGIGWSTTVGAAKDDVEWTTLSNHNGTILYFPASSGNLMDLTAPNNNAPIHIKDLMVLGGGGTAVAFAFGSASGSKVEAHWDNVLAANTNLAYNFINVEDCQFTCVRSRGNTNGFYLGNGTNENTFITTEILAGTGRGIQCVGAALNRFYGGVIQGWHEGVGIYSALLDFSEHNFFGEFWFENFDTFTEIEWLNGTSSVFQNWRVGHGSLGGFHIGANAVNCMLINLRILSAAPILNEGNGTRFWFMHPGNGGTVTDTGINTFFYPDPNVSGGLGDRMKLPHDLSVMGKIQVTDGLYNAAGTTKLIDAAVPATTWVPTFTAISNVTMFPAGTRGAYTINHGMVHASVFLVIRPTADGASTVFDIDLPFTASGVLDDLNAFGTGVCYKFGNPDSTGQPMVLGNSNTTKVRVTFIAPVGTAGNDIRQYLSFDYPA